MSEDVAFGAEEHAGWRRAAENEYVRRALAELVDVKRDLRDVRDRMVDADRRVGRLRKERDEAVEAKNRIMGVLTGVRSDMTAGEPERKELRERLDEALARIDEIAAGRQPAGEGS